MSVKLQIEPYLECLSLKGGCTGSFESTCVNMPHCWESHVPAELCCGVGSFEHPKHMLKLIGKKIFTIILLYAKKICSSTPCVISTKVRDPSSNKRPYPSLVAKIAVFFSNLKKKSSL